MTDPTKTAMQNQQAAQTPIIKTGRITREDCLLAALQGMAANPGFAFRNLDEAHRRTVDMAEKMWAHIQEGRRVAVPA